MNWILDLLQTMQIINHSQYQSKTVFCNMKHAPGAMALRLNSMLKKGNMLKEIVEEPLLKL